MATKQRYLIWLDILGFKDLVEKIAKESHLEERKVRTDFINIINERVNHLENQHYIIGKNYGERDDWLLVASSLDSVFQVVHKVLDHNTGYKKHKDIPLEIAIGVGEYDKWARFDGAKLIVENSTVENLKLNVVKHYHRWYSQKHNNKPVKRSFIILTKSAYGTLEPLDRRMCRRIDYKQVLRKGEVATFFVASAQNFQRRGKVFEFLERIKSPGSRLYYRIDELFVPPIEYEEIKRTLKTKRVVIITGVAEYGKTYTAIRLLWEFFIDGYEPIWRVGGGKWEREEVRKKLRETERELIPGHVIYYEDPFGKMRYERSETLEREIGMFLESVERVENVYVIMTSREEIFKEFEKEHLSSVELGSFEKKLDMKRPSYNYEKRKEILVRWAESKSCRWRLNDSLVNTILDHIKDERKLPTPLSIRDFVYSSVSLVGECELLKKIEDKSKETARSFAREVENMSDDKILFLFFPFISNFSIRFVKSKYEKLIKTMKDQRPWDFERILDWFKDDKVAVYNKRIVFSHSSYYEALGYLLVDKGRPTRINRDLYSKVLLELLKSDDAVSAAAVEIAYNYDKISEMLRILFFELFENEEVVDRITETVAEDFDGLSDQIKGTLLLRLAKNDYSVPWVVSPIIRNYNMLPKKVRDLLVELSESEKTVELVVLEMIYNFDRAPKEVRDLLIEISKRPGVQSIIRHALSDYDALPEKARDELLLKLAQNRKTAPAVSSAVTLNFDDIPFDVRNKLLLELSKRGIGRVALDIVFNFDKLPPEVRNLLSELPVDDRTADSLAEILLEEFDELPNALRNQLIIKLAKNDHTAWLMGWVIAENYNKLPQNVRDLLFLIAGNQKAAGQVARAIERHFDRLPCKVRKLLDKLPKSHSCDHGNRL